MTSYITPVPVRTSDHRRVPGKLHRPGGGPENTRSVPERQLCQDLQPQDEVALVLDAASCWSLSDPGTRNVLCVPLTAAAHTDGLCLTELGGGAGAGGRGDEEPPSPAKKGGGGGGGGGKRRDGASKCFDACERIRRHCRLKSRLNRISSSHDRKATKKASSSDYHQEETSNFACCFVSILKVRTKLLLCCRPCVGLCLPQGN